MCAISVVSKRTVQTSFLYTRRIVPEFRFPCPHHYSQTHKMTREKIHLEKDRKKRMIESIPDTARVIISEYLAKNED